MIGPIIFALVLVLVLFILPTGVLWSMLAFALIVVAGVIWALLENEDEPLPPSR